MAGAQRRVTSEELGVGFGVVLARRWFRHALCPGVPIGFIDVDVYVWGSGFGGSIRSDYLLIAPDAAKADCYRVRLLECKGTQEEPVARSQMRKAVRQLGSPIILPLPDGIAVSSVTYGDQVRCFAVETRGEGEASYQPDWEAKDVRWGTGELSWSAETGGFLAAALRKTWSRLADFGGNVEAYKRSEVAILRSSLLRSQDSRKESNVQRGSAGHRAAIVLGRARRIHILPRTIELRCYPWPVDLAFPARKRFAHYRQGRVGGGHSRACG